MKINWRYSTMNRKLSIKYATQIWWYRSVLVEITAKKFNYTGSLCNILSLLVLIVVRRILFRFERHIDFVRRLFQSHSYEWVMANLVRESKINAIFENIRLLKSSKSSAFGFQNTRMKGNFLKLELRRVWIVSEPFAFTHDGFSLVQI